MKVTSNFDFDKCSLSTLLATKIVCRVELVKTEVLSEKKEIKKILYKGLTHDDVEQFMILKVLYMLVQIQYKRLLNTRF